MLTSIPSISRHFSCLECIILERMKQVKETLVDIDILDRATHTAEAQLSNIRRSAVSIRSIRQDTESDVSQVEEARLTLQIESLQSEKSHLTTMLPSFRMATACSDDELNDGDKEDVQEQPNEIINYGNGNRTLSTAATNVQAGCVMRPQLQQSQKDSTSDNSDPTTMNVCIV